MVDVDDGDYFSGISFVNIPWGMESRIRSDETYIEMELGSYVIRSCGVDEFRSSSFIKTRIMKIQTKESYRLEK